ncbi:hypothetical protein QR680_006807 [Steinernema hermaphroditum]|uniref:Uncharacterized protein n=1 Tax=Steinernema hermaphroditum TaxID=289476 RepID=A0AA39HYY0_9BILA|nr:hypothetical protein QR680_006807 [Steinernema hermaphroditum]
MDDLPFNFYDSLFSMVFMRTSQAAQSLAGSIGLIAQDFYENLHDHELFVRDNDVVMERQYNYGQQACTPLRTLHRKFTGVVSVNFVAGNDKAPNDGFIQRVQSINGSGEYAVSFYGLGVSQSWNNWVYSLQRITELFIYNRLPDAGKKLCRNIIEKRSLRRLQIDYEKCGAGELGLMQTVLCQDQFVTLHLINSDMAVFLKLLHFCSDNREKVAGRSLGLYKNSANFAESFESKLKGCLDAESDSIGKKYFFFHRCYFDESSMPYRLSDPPAYVFFECKGKEADMEEMKFLKDSGLIAMLLV